MFKGLDGKRVFLRFLPDGRFVPCAPSRKPARVVGRVVNIDRERGVVTFVADGPGERDGQA